MNKLIGCAALALAMTLPALASAQVFPTCTDARNYGYNTAELYVGQAFSRMNCAPGQLERTEEALTTAIQDMSPRFIDNDAMRLCYYEGFQDGAMDRLGEEYARCGRIPAFPRLTFVPMARFSIAVFSSMTRSLQRLPGAAGLKQVFDRSYGAPEYFYCVRTLEAAELAILGAAGVSTYLRTLNMLEQEVCR